MTSSPSQALDGHVPDARANPPPARLIALLILIALTATLVGQVLIALDLVTPPDANAFFDASAASVTLFVNAGAAIVTGVAAFVLPARLRGLAILPGAGLLAATLGGALTLGGHLWDAAAAVLIFATIWQLGRWVTSALAPESLRHVPVIDLVIGAGVLGLLVELLGRLHVIKWYTAGAVVVLVGFLGLLRAGKGAAARAGRAWQAVTVSPLAAAAAGIIALQLGLAMIWLSAPDIMYDALYGKAYLPELWAHTGAIGPLVRDPALNLVGLAQVIATPGHSLGSEDVGRWLQDLSWITVVATFWWWGGRRSALGPIAAVALAVTPHLMWQNSTAFDDNVLMLPAAALAIAVFRTLQGPVRRATFHTALVIGLLGGAAIWFKLHLGVLAVVLVAGWVLTAGPLRELPRRAAGAFGGAVLFALPVLVLRWIDTGNPLFPSYNGIFKSKYGPPVNDTLNFPFEPHAAHFDWLRLPYDAVAHAVRMSEAAPPGAYGLLVPVVATAVLVGWRGSDRRVALVGWAALVLAMVVWWTQLRYLRYGVPIAVVASLLLMTQFRGWQVRRGINVAAVVLAVLASVVFLPSTVAAFWNVPGKRVPFAAAFGHWAKHDYLRTVFPEEDTLAAYQAMAPKGADAVSDAHERLFLTDRSLSITYEVARRLTLFPPAPKNGDEAYAKLKQLGLGWAIVQTDGTSETYFPWLREAIDAHGQVVFSDRAWALFRFVDAPIRPPLEQDCDPLLRHRAGCWAGTMDNIPGLAGPETVYRAVAACPGATVGLLVRTAPGGAPAEVNLRADVATTKVGFAVALVQPGTTEWVYVTVPPGSSHTGLFLKPGAGGRVERADTGVLRSGCRAGG